MLKSIISAAAVSLMALTMMAPTASARANRYYSDHGRSYYYDRHHHRHYQNCRTAGTVVGVVTGAVLGNALTGHSGVGTVVGAGVGGVAGHQIASRNCRR
jgi:hypothetical protein